MTQVAPDRAKALAEAIGSGRPLVMGILNVTPDSFSDGGLHRDPMDAVARARVMVAEGGAIVDVGGESTRPGHEPVSEAEERARVLPVLEQLAGAGWASIDTTKAAVARAALDRGAVMVNDQWGFQGDPAMAEIVAEAGAFAVLMHNRRAVDAALPIADELLRFFEASLAIAARAGVAPERLVLDPGIGFGKSGDQQLDALRALPRLRSAFGLPILVGVSRKSVLGHITGAAVGDRLPETLAANLFALVQGAQLFRVHDVAAHVAAFKVTAALASRDLGSA